MPKPQIEVFIAGTPSCYDALRTVANVAGDRCDIIVHNLAAGVATRESLTRAKVLRIAKVPSVALDGNLIDPADRNPVSSVVLTSKLARKAA